MEQECPNCLQFQRNTTLVPNSKQMPSSLYPILAVFLIFSACNPKENASAKTLLDVTAIQKELAGINARDQAVREVLSCAQETFGSNGKSYQDYWSAVSMVDSIHTARVTEILDQYGWLGLSQIGREANTTLWLIIQHSTPEIMEKYLPLMRESVMNGESQGGQYGMLVDRVLMNQGKPQRYGSQIVQDGNTGAYKLYELENPETVDLRRDSIGLGSLQEYVARWGISLDQTEIGL